MRPSAEGRPAAQGCMRRLATAAWIGPRDSGMASFTCLPPNVRSQPMLGPRPACAWDVKEPGIL